MSLKDSAVRGIKWSGASQIGRQVTQLITTLILARLLSPSDFGLVAMAAAVMGFIYLFRGFGTGAAVIQSRDSSPELLSSVFWFNAGFGILATIIVFLFSPMAAIFFQDARLDLLLKVLALSFIFSGIGILPQSLLEQNLKFKLLAKLETSAVLAGSLVGIGMALLGYGVWSLVYQSLCITFLTAVFLCFYCSWRPQWVFHWSQIRKISGFSLNLTGFHFFNYLARNADDILIGRFLGPQYLGYYNMAYRILLLPLRNISEVVGRVMFPVYSQIQDDDKKIRSGFLRISGAVAMITFPMMFGLIALAHPFVTVLFGQKWGPMILLVMILAPLGMAQSITTSVGGIYMSKGRTDWMFRWGVFSGLLVVAAFVVGLQWGIIGVASAYTFMGLLLTYPAFYIPFKLIGLPMRDLGKELWPPFFCGLLMFAGLLGLHTLLPAHLSDGSTLAFLIPAGCMIYMVFTWLLNRGRLREILETL